MSFRMYHSLQQIKKNHGRLAMLVVCLFLLLPCLFAVHYGLNYLFDFIPARYHDTVNLIEEMILLGFIFMVLWYYHRNRHLLDEQLKQQMHLKLFIKHAPIAVAMTDCQMRYLAASDRWLQDFNLSYDHIIGQSHYDVFSDIQEMSRWRNDHQRCLNGETIRCEEDSFITKDGKREWISYEILPWRNPNGRIGGLIFFIEFITNRITTLNRLKESEARFERAMRGTNDGLWDWDLTGDQIYFSSSFKALMGYADDEIENIIDTWRNMLHPDDVTMVMKAIDDHLKRKKPYDVHYRLKHKTGYYIWIHARGQAEWNERNEPTYFSGIMTDISEKRRLEELKNEFVYVVTHELRTPLSALRGALDMLPRLLGEDLPTKAKKSLDLSLQGCDRLSSLVNDLLEVGKAESGTMQFDIHLHDINILLQKAVDMNADYARQYQTSIDLTLPDNTVMVAIDAKRFQQIMSNLISNAAKFSKADGIIHITCCLQGQEVVISVMDHGMGIPYEFQKRIFQKFARSNSDKPGTGLGLNITKTMVEKMGGKIWFHSEEDHGTTFCLSFPLISA